MTEQPAEPVSVTDVSLEPHPLAGDERCIRVSRLICPATGIDAAPRICELRCIETDVSDSLQAPIDLDRDRVTVGHAHHGRHVPVLGRSVGRHRRRLVLLPEDDEDGDEAADDREGGGTRQAAPIGPAADHPRAARRRA